MPELFPYCYTSYAHPSWLFYGPDIVLSQEGKKQRDPFGPLLFSNTLQSLLQPLSSALTLAYLDDITLGGSEDVVAADIQTTITEGEAMGLHLNNKCEIIAHQQTVISDPMLCSFNRDNVDAELLGAPLFASRVFDTAWVSRCSELSRAIDRLQLICAQDALTLLCVSFSAPGVQHLMRCSPSVDNPALADFDKLLRCTISYLTNCDLSDEQWLQASLATYQDGWFRSEKSVVAGTSGLSGIGCKHCITS